MSPQPCEHTFQEESRVARPIAPVTGGHLSAGPAMGVPFALAGGVVAWLVLATFYPVFGIPKELRDLAGQPMTSEEGAKLTAALAKARRQNAMFALAVLGAAVGGSLGIAEGFARGPVNAVAVGLALSTLIGGAVGSVGGLLGDLTWVTVKPFAEPMPLAGTVRVQAVALTILGAGVGLSLGASTARLWSAVYCLFAGLLAGLGSGLLSPILIGYVLPEAQTEWMVPSSGGSLLLWSMVPAAMLGLAVPGTAGTRPPRAGASVAGAAGGDAA